VVFVYLKIKPKHLKYITIKNLEAWLGIMSIVKLQNFPGSILFVALLLQLQYQ
jgi:hypothetical protein